MVQASGANQASHYALVRALDSGTPRIDRWHVETVDKAYVDGHYFSVKAPGLATWTLPWFAANDAVGLVSEAQERGRSVAADEGASGGDERARLVREQRAVVWLLGLWAVVLPALALLVLVRAAAERVAPGHGTAAAVVCGVGTLVLPYSTMLYSHVPAAALAFGAYVLATRERHFLAGVLSGLAALVEYPVALVALVLVIATRSWRVAAGAALGIAPLALYNLWAFGSPFEMSYDDVVGFEGQEEGLFGVSLPDPGAAWDLLLSPKGLLVLTPVVAAGVYGLVRARLWVPLAIVLAIFLYDAAYYLPFGGDVPGPRFLVPALPFVALGIAVALRERLAATLALAAASVVGMAAATIAEPQLVGDDTSRWTDLLADGDLQFTVAGAAGAGHGWLGILPFLVLLGVAAVLAARSVPGGGATAVAGEAARAGGGVAALGGAAAALTVWAALALLLGNAPVLVAAGVLAGVGAASWAGRWRACSGKDRSPVPSTASSTTATPRS
jgi:hypothetical protein